MRQGVLKFSVFSKQLKHADNTYSYDIQHLSNQTDILIQPGKQTVNHIKSQNYTENDFPSIIQPSPNLEDNNNLSICPVSTTTRNK